jgi:hypothetical protein
MPGCTEQRPRTIGLDWPSIVAAGLRRADLAGRLGGSLCGGRLARSIGPCARRDRRGLRRRAVGELSRGGVASDFTGALVTMDRRIASPGFCRGNLFRRNVRLARLDGC